MTGSAARQLHKGIVLDDRYKILEVIGSGGFGITYKAVSLNQDKTVAIKEFFCQEYMTRDAEAYPAARVYLEGYQERFESDRRKFLKEARIIRDFSEEPGIVHILDYFEANQTAYIVMEYLEGETLKDLLAREKRIPARDIFKKMIPLISTLGKVHKGGVIHRDISPDNIMVLKDGSLRLIDFGAARNFAGSDTSYAMVLKDGYTPQEQYTGQEQGPWTDIYALSATLYQCITGRVPDNALQRILHDELKHPSDLSIKIDSRLEHILMKGLALAGSKRYQTTDEMMKDIREVIPEDDEKKRLSRKARILLSMTALLFLTILLSAGWYVKAHWIEIKFRGRETINITLKRASINQADYNTSLKLLEERLKIFTNDNYVLEKTDSSHVRLYFLQSLCQDKEILYVLRNYLSRPMTFSVNLRRELSGLDELNSTGEAEKPAIPNHPVSLDPGDFLDVTLKKGQINGVQDNQRKTLGLPETGKYYYIHVTLTEDKARELKSLYQYKESFQIEINRETNPMSLYYLIAYVCDDGRSFDIIDHDQEKHFQETLVHNLTSRKLPEAFVIEDYTWPVKWENPSDSLIAGKNQVKREALKGETLTIKYNQYSSEEENLNQGKRFGSMMAFKSRLDSLQIPYSFGLSKEKSSTIIVCMETSRLLGVMPELVCTESSFTLSSPLGSLYSLLEDKDSFDLIKGKDGLPAFRCPVPSHGFDYKDTTPEDLITFMRKYDDLDFILRTGNNHYLARGRMTGAETDGWLVLDQILLAGDSPVSYSTAEAIYPLLKMILQEDLLTLYSLEDYRFHNAEGTLLPEKTFADLPDYFDQTQNQTVFKAAEKAGFEASVKDTSIMVSFHCQPENAAEAAERFETFFQQNKLFHSFYRYIYYEVYDSKDKNYLYRFSISSNSRTDSETPGRNMRVKIIDDACRASLTDHIQKTPFYDAFTIREE